MEARAVGDFMKPSTIRVLVVDDFEPWRRFVSVMLRTKPGLRIVGEASDGSEAFQKAVELEPDLILMDIGLPTVNGLDTVRRIRDFVPEAKIILLSDESSFDVVTTVETVLSGLKIVNL
jgi:DNA-binding NarL/FixJ family response regulator